MTLFDELINIRDKQREVAKSQPIVLRGGDLPWEQSAHGKLKWYMHPAVNRAWNAYTLYTQEVLPGSKSGRQKCQGGVLFYMLEGTLLTRVNDELYEWSAGDLLTLPVLREGVVFQHINPAKSKNSRILACEINTVHCLGVDKGSGFEELEPCGEIGEHPTEPIIRRGSFLNRPRDLSANFYTQYDRDIKMWKMIRERHEMGKILIRGSDVRWEQNRMGRVCYYLNPEFPDTAIRDWTVFIQDIHTHTGMHRHQGGLMIYVVEGEGYTVCDGRNYDWKANDVIIFPVKPGGVEHQHFNGRVGETCKWIVMFYWPWWELVASEFVQLKEHPDYTAKH